MKIIKTIPALRETLRPFRRQGRRIGFVPTMGALHAGHAALLRQCRKDNDIVILSIFVNPAQFGPKEDFAKYPREKKKDVLLAKKEDVDIIFYPSVDEMYPENFATRINVEEITDTLCGKSRPGHFRGVATVVGKLLNIVQPDRMYLGQKDAQQCAVLKRMAVDLNFPVEIKIVPTVREKDGLALSSRNQYLSPKERREATVLSQALRDAKKAIASGERNAAKLVAGIKKAVSGGSSGKIDYVACVDAETLKDLRHLKTKDKVLIAVAVFFGSTRLIDNILVEIK